MYVCMCVYVYVCMCVYVYVCMCVYVYVCLICCCNHFSNAMILCCLSFSYAVLIFIVYRESFIYYFHGLGCGRNSKKVLKLRVSRWVPSRGLLLVGPGRKGLKAIPGGSNSK